MIKTPLKGGKKMGKRLMGVFGALLLVSLMVGSSHAAVYSYFDSAKGVNFSLNFTGGSGNSFTLTGSQNSADLFLTSFNFKFSDNDTWTLTNLSPILINADAWKIATATTQVMLGGSNYGVLLQSNQVGFYNKDASTDAGASRTGIASVAVNEDFPKTFTFDLQQTAFQGLDAWFTSIPFQAQYVTNTGTVARFQGFLSEHLNGNNVPEAGALMLFGTGLVALVGYRRVHRMK